jgi:Uma2 family endonuclease
MTAQHSPPILKDIKTPKGEAVSDNRLTLAEYVEREAFSTVKHEFHHGKIVERIKRKPVQVQIVGNFGTFLNLSLFKKTKRFIAYDSNAEIYIPELDKSLYADVSAVEGKPILFANYKTLITNPLLIIEVLSDGTQDYDRHRKFEFYQKIPTFKEYILVHQDQPKIEIYYCKNGKRNVWNYTFATGLSESIKLQSVGCTLRLKDIYRNIEF